MTAMWEAVPSQDDIEAEWLRMPSFVRSKWGAVITSIVWMARQQERAAVLAAADAGETEGPYFVTFVPDAECGDSWKVQRQEPHISGDPASFSFVLIVELFDKAEAVGVRNVLNRVAARERGVGT